MNQKMLNQFARLVALLSVALILGCDKTATPPEKEQIQMGVILNLTGSAAKVDEPKKKAMEVAAEFLSGKDPNKRISLVFEDGKSAAKDSVGAFRSLQSRGIKIFLAGSSLSAMPIAPLAKSSNDLLFAVSGHPDFTKQAGLGIRCYPDVTGSAQIVGAYLRKIDARNVFILHMEEPWTQSYAQELRALLPEGTGSNGEAYPVGHQDFRDIASKVKAASPDCVVLLDFGISMKAIISAFLEMGVEAKLLGCETAHVANLPSVAGFDKLDFVFLATEFTRKAAEGADEFAKFFQDRTAESAPPYYAVLCADALALLSNAVDAQKAPAGSAPKDIHSAIISLPEIAGFSGLLKVQPSGDVKYQLGLYRYSGQRLVPEDVGQQPKP